MFVKSLVGAFFTVFVVLLPTLAETTDNNSFATAHGKYTRRSKRYLTFPEGSSLSIAICMTAQMGITPGELFTTAVNWGISYELPNDTATFKEFLPENQIKRRNRRDLYGKMEKIITSMGYNGRACILRALCEASFKFRSNNNSLVEKFVQIVFGFLDERIPANEPDEHRMYHWAAQTGYSEGNEKCASLFANGCPFSLIDFALGYYEYSHMYDP